MAKEEKLCNAHSVGCQGAGGCTDVVVLKMEVARFNAKNLY